MDYSSGELAIRGSVMPYITFGNGEKDFVIISGISLGGIRDLGGPVSAAYSLFAKDYRVWLFARPDSVPEGYSVEDMASDIAQSLEMLGITQADFFGASLGGMILQIIAANYPALVRKAVIVSSLCCPNEMSHSSFKLWEGLSSIGNVTALNRSFFELVYPAEFVEQNREAFEALIPVGTKEQCSRFHTLICAAAVFDSREVLHKIKCPVLVIGDRNDNVLSGKASEELAELLQCELYMYSGYGHAVYDLAPDIKERMFDFLKK